MKTLLLTAAGMLSVALGAGSADAGYGLGGYGYSSGYNYGGGYSYPSYGSSSHLHHNVSPWIQPSRGHYDYHNTSHLDYRPARVVPHGNHLDYNPGGYYLHQSGHYDLHN